MRIEPTDSKNDTYRQDDACTSRWEVWKMFDRIAGQYDLLNHLLSFGQDFRWRNHLSQQLKHHETQKILDLATGTADQLISLLSKNRNIQSAIGLDMSKKMLETGQKKITRKKLNHAVRLQVGNASQIPFPDNTFDAVTMSFGIRNVTDVNQTLKEMHRVLKPNGKALILEFSLPENDLIRKIYLTYLRKILPNVGEFFSKDKYAYRYLKQTIEDFPHGQAFCRLLSSAGFMTVHSDPLSFGAVTLYQGDKSACITE